MPSDRWCSSIRAPASSQRIARLPPRAAARPSRRWFFRLFAIALSFVPENAWAITVGDLRAAAIAPGIAFSTCEAIDLSDNIPISENLSSPPHFPAK
jgi:hypothetical protein